MNDQEYLDEALKIVRERVPGAVAVRLDTSEQDTTGFVLYDVELPDGVMLSETNNALCEKVADEVWDLVSSIAWNGVVGEDKHGDARVAL